MASLPQDISQVVATALAEDIGKGDLTGELVRKDITTKAKVISRESGVLCGCAWFDEVYRQLSSEILVEWRAADRDQIFPEQIICELTGPAHPILSGERTALNFLQMLSGVATQTRNFVNAVQGTATRILDTRKTIPGLRTAQKYAVTCGGGTNHRLGLYESLLVKENHIAVSGSFMRAVKKAQTEFPGKKLEVEVENFQELLQALSVGVDIILLDNFSVENIKEAAQLNQGKAKLEVSGGITLDNVREIARTGVDFISVGALTKDIKAIDLSMRVASE